MGTKVKLHLMGVINGNLFDIDASPKNKYDAALIKIKLK